MKHDEWQFRQFCIGWPQSFIFCIVNMIPKVNSVPPNNKELILEHPNVVHCPCQKSHLSVETAMIFLIHCRMPQWFFSLCNNEVECVMTKEFLRQGGAPLECTFWKWSNACCPSTFSRHLVVHHLSCLNEVQLSNQLDQQLVVGSDCFQPLLENVFSLTCHQTVPWKAADILNPNDLHSRKQWAFPVSRQWQFWLENNENVHLRWQNWWLSKWMTTRQLADNCTQTAGWTMLSLHQSQLLATQTDAECGENSNTKSQLKLLANQNYQLRVGVEQNRKVPQT